MASAFIRHINSSADLNKLIEEKPVVIIDFNASWCGPCHAIAPFYSQLADNYRTVTFTKVDVDQRKDIAQKYNVTAMPTFVLIKNKQEVERLRGADPRGLEQLVKKFAPPKAAADSGGDVVAGDVSLLEYLDIAQVNCLNEAQNHTLKSILSGKARNLGDNYLESDADEQLLINLVFNQVVKIRSLVLHTKESKAGPKDIKLQINQPSIGFDDVEDAKEPEVVQVIELPEEFVKEGKHIHLRFVRLQRVNSLHIFVSSNFGGLDETRIDAIDVFGQPVATPNVSGLKKVDDE